MSGGWSSRWSTTAKTFEARHGAGGKDRAPAADSGRDDQAHRHRLTHALDDLASHMDLDQYALASMTDDQKEGVASHSSNGASRAFQGEVR